MAAGLGPPRTRGRGLLARSPCRLAVRVRAPGRRPGPAACVLAADSAPHDPAYAYSPAVAVGPQRRRGEAGRRERHRAACSSAATTFLTRGGVRACLADTLASSLARALGRYYHLAGRLAVEEHGERTIIGEGAEIVHAAVPGVAVADIVGSVYTPSSVVWAFFPLNGLHGTDVAIVSLPVLWAQVTELTDGIFIGMSMNHSVGDGTSFWDLFNACRNPPRLHPDSVVNRGDKLMGEMVSTPARVRWRWFVDTSPLSIPIPSSKLQQVVHQRLEPPPVREGFFTFSAANVKKLKARANDEMAGGATMSSLQAVLAHLWLAASRARRLPPGQEMF
uniref:Acetyltransferase n=1 Tax=Triticum aestivum TaxID=4565 RepID=A0A077RY95_WHEAT|nr:unnamed protein product [Triticum aestivum]